MSQYSSLRQLLHQSPELSGQEKNTSETVLSYLGNLGPDKVVRGLGGYGLAAIYSGRQDGPRVLVRCELDALPISETLDISYRSNSGGVSHKCGHDGHMAMLVGLAERFHEQRPNKGSVALLFQPSEETGEGAQRVLNDPQFTLIEPDFVLAVHNLPGFPLGSAIIRENVFASASSGLHLHLTGETSHASQPEAGRSPALAVAELIQRLSAIPQFHTAFHEAAQVTVIHARVGEVAFGTSPGEGDVMVTLRAHSQETIDTLAKEAISAGEHTARSFGLDVTHGFRELFPPTINNGEVVSLVETCAREIGLKINRPDTPFAWSEDFGHFTSKYNGALFGLGAGEDCPALHHPDYDFPDTLLEPGINLLESTTRQLLEWENV